MLELTTDSEAGRVKYLDMIMYISILPKKTENSASAKQRESSE